jgi:hypothetical protein
MTQYGEGIGGTYTVVTPVEDTPGRQEKVITRIVDGKRVVVRVRADVAPVDPMLVLIRASLYSKAVRGAPFPVPPISRQIKEALTRMAS